MSETEYAHVMEEQDINNARQKEEHDNAITALTIFEQGLCKSAIKSMAENAINSVLETGNILQVAEALSAMIEFVETVKKDDRFKNYVREEAGKTPKGFISNSGAKIELAETGTAYDFSKCDDPTLVNLEEKLKKITDEVKARKDFLKTVPLSGMEVLIDDELVKVYPPSKTSTSSYKITLAK